MYIYIYIYIYLFIIIYQTVTKVSYHSRRFCLTNDTVGGINSETPKGIYGKYKGHMKEIFEEYMQEYTGIYEEYDPNIHNHL